MEKTKNCRKHNALPVHSPLSKTPAVFHGVCRKTGYPQEGFSLPQQIVENEGGKKAGVNAGR
ncbi:MAG: hypothetical protein HFG02_10300 [Oscillibacter sp.]|nr:hypothetical protein [Oscillibacter sp.]